MDEAIVDPYYEYEAPQFFDFINVDNIKDEDEEKQLDAWFDNKPGDSGGAPILDDSESKTDDESCDKDVEEICYGITKPCTEYAKPENIKNDERVNPATLEEVAKLEEVNTKVEEVESSEVEEEPCITKPCSAPTEYVKAQGEDVEYSSTKLEEVKVVEKMVDLANPEKSEDFSDAKQSENINGCKSEYEFSNDSLDEVKDHSSEARESCSEVDQKPDSKHIAVETTQQPNQSKIVTSWCDREKRKVNSLLEANKTCINKTQSDGPKMETRGQKRNRVLSVSASSDVPSKKQKEIVEQRKDVRRSSKRARSLSNNIGKKSGLTFPVTPQCLKRQKLAKPTMIKLKTTEEMEMERITKMRKQTRHHIKVNQNLMKKAISSTAYLPVRTATDLTKTQEFHFQTDKRVVAKPQPMTTVDDTEKEFLKSLRQHPPSPTWKHRGVTKPKPFNLTGGGGQAKRKLASLDTDEKVVDSYQSMAYQVYKFQTTTPPRFRTKKANNGGNKTAEKPVEKPAEKPLKVTFPVTPKLSTTSRARPVAEDVLSKEAQEEKEVEAMKSYHFKAKPFDRRIVECDGLYGVKEIPKDKKHQTEMVPFSFESDDRLEARKQKTDSQEEPAVFKAIPQPSFEKVFRPQLKHARTAPKPFSFEEKDKDRWEKKENKIQEVYKEEDKLREFKAQLLPPDSPDILPEVSSKSGTSFKPFELNTENRGAIKAEKWIQKVQTELQEERKKVVFHAKPNKVVHEDGFVPQKSQRPLTDVSEFALNTNRRADRWEQIDTVKKEQGIIDEELRKDREDKQEAEEKAAIATLRKQLVHKAKPVLKYKEVEIKPSDVPLTTAQSPAWSELKRRRIENIR